MTVISNIANGFIGLFNAGGEQFMSWVTGIIPLVICHCYQLWLLSF